MALVLASNSPRRRELLRMVGARFEVDAEPIDEQLRDGEAPREAVERLAVAKAAAVAQRRPEDLVIGADTVVVIDGEILGKPRDREVAATMIRRLSGRTHEVWTGVAVVHRATGAQAVASEQTLVTFRHLEPDTVARYVATGEGMDKAGGYAVQGVGALLVERVEGCWTNVVGLPLGRLEGLLRPFGIRLL